MRTQWHKPKGVDLCLFTQWREPSESFFIITSMAIVHKEVHETRKK